MEKKIIKKKLVLKKKVRTTLTKIMLVIIIVLITLISIKANPNLKIIIKENIYEKSLEFTKARKIYSKYFGNIIPIEKIMAEEKPVFNEKLAYKKETAYENGVELQVSQNYLVPALESGVVIFLGEKNDYGKTLIIEQVNGIAVFYSNIEFVDIKLYDFIEKGELLGEAKEEKIYLAFSKEGKYLNYKEFI